MHSPLSTFSIPTHSQAFIGTLLVNQPFYISGVNEDLEKNKSSIFTACGIFVFAFFVSLGGIWHDNKTADDRENPENYQLNQAAGYGSRYD
mmetsp:Transcript_35184/g.81350  ORF Transcript_35184/g.81350 Transcript_35184/m.81350 type:complete len:91 (+) Transcript_35184:439-711(+)